MKSLTIGVLLLSLALMPVAEGKTPNTPRPAAGFYVVHFAETPLATYDGDVAGLEATRGGRKLDARSPASIAYLAFLDLRQQQHLARMRQALSRDVGPVFRYVAAGNGMAVRLSSGEAAIVADLPGVSRVVRDYVVPLATDRGPIWIGAPSIWDGSATGGLPGTQGAGVIVGSIDSGVNMDHPSFAATGGDGFTHTNPFGAGVFAGWCDPSNPNFDPSYVCNHKLIGAWDYTDAYCAANPGVCSESDGPEDGDGHGSHTASTAAGNVLSSPAISGVARHANLITYDACYVDGGGQGLCPFSTTLAAVDQAILDGVDVINYSIGGGGDPWSESDIDRAFLNAVAAGIYAAASAGNDGPGAGTSGHDGPWVSTTGASTHDRVRVENELIDMTGGGSPPGDVAGASRTTGYGPAPIVYAGDFANGDPDPEQCLQPFPAGTWSGEIVLCDRGTIDRVVKCANVAAGGAAGCILANVAASQGDPVFDPHVIPAIAVGLPDGDALRGWLAGGTGHTGTITDATVVTDPAIADVMRGSSSRGPAGPVAVDVVKPDLTAPGASIFAAVDSDGETPAPEFGTISGTSMSSPHNAGSAALLSALYPGWSPPEIKSALMLSADTTVLKENGATPGDPFDFGGGRIELTRAAEVGLVLDESFDDFLDANPDAGGDTRTLNLASLQHGTCVLGCSWSRTVRSVAAASVDWTVTAATPVGLTLTPSPAAFTLPAGAEQVIDFTADVTGLPFGAFLFAEIELTEPGGSPDLHLPVAIRPSATSLPAQVSIETEVRAGTLTLAEVANASNITDLEVGAAGLVAGTRTTVSLDQDPTNDDPFDDLEQVFVKLVTVTAGARRLVAATESVESLDVDLYIGTEQTPLCESASPGNSERCELIDPAPGTYWIIVQNWAGSGAQPDDIQLVDALVPGVDSGNFGATGPIAVAAGTPFDLEIFWDEPAMQTGDVWFAVLDIGTDAGNPGNVGSVNVDLELLGIFADGFESGDTSAWSSTVP